MSHPPRPCRRGHTLVVLVTPVCCSPHNVRPSPHLVLVRAHGPITMAQPLYQSSRRQQLPGDWYCAPPAACCVLIKAPSRSLKQGTRNAPAPNPRTHVPVRQPGATATPVTRAALGGSTGVARALPPANRSRPGELQHGTRNGLTGTGDPTRPRTAIPHPRKTAGHVYGNPRAYQRRPRRL
jgi:hypothetical protein